MGFFHVHKWAIERQQTIEVKRRLIWEGEYDVHPGLAKIELCPCGMRRAFIMDSAGKKQVDSDYLLAMLGEMAKENTKNG